MKKELLIEGKSEIQSKLIKKGLNAIPVIFGSIFFAMLAQVAIPLPFTSVPMSLQTFGVALLAIFLGKRQAPLALMAYLMQATMGLPVLAGGVMNPFWMIGPNAGYLAAFVLASYLVAKLLEKHTQNSIVKTWLLFSVNETVVLCIGTAWLALFVGMENAFYMGFIPFVPGALLKITLASSLLRPVRWLQQKF